MSGRWPCWNLASKVEPITWVTVPVVVSVAVALMRGLGLREVGRGV